MNIKITAWMVNAGAAIALALAGTAAGQVTQQAKLLASDGAESDNLGDAVAVSNGVAIVGAPREGAIVTVDPPTNDNKGAAYIYRDTGGVWSEEALLIASDRASFDEFGISVAINGDVAVVGARQDSHLGIKSGSVYVFSGLDWGDETKLLAAGRAASDNFGVAVAIDGDVIVVGANGADATIGSEETVVPDAGAAYVFRKDGSSWIQAAKLTASDAADLDGFGETVAIDGDLIVVGARFNDNGGSATGSAYVFRRNDSGTPLNPADDVWEEETPILVADDAAANDQFGDSVSVSGNTIVVGAAQADATPGDNAGAAYVFERDESVEPVWAQSQKLVGSGFGTTGQEFGKSVAIHGNLIAVGAFKDGDGFGATYIYSRTGGIWSELVKLDFLNVIDPDTMLEQLDDDDEFGGAIALGSDSRLIVGAIGDDDNGSSGGAAYIFSIDTGSSDTDGDGIDDDLDNCPDDANADQLDTDLDTLGDACDPDDDNDGLSDADEAFFGTDPLEPDTDNDGLDDGDEVELADANCEADPDSCLDPCPDPLNPDSDGDSLEDGDEVTPPVGTEVTDPCKADTDDDGVNDNDDPLPIEEGVTEDFLAEWTADVAVDIGDLDLGLFVGPNQIVKLVRRNTLALLTFAASLLIDSGNYAAAHALLSVVESRIDDDTPPPDWMNPGPAQADLHGEVNLLLALLQLLE